MTKTITWNGLSSTLIPELIIGPVSRQILGSQRGTHVEIDGKEGSYYFPQQRGRRSITVEMSILVNAMADRGDAVEAVADWLDVIEEAQLIISDYPDRYYLATLEDIPTVEEWRHLAGPFEVEWSTQPYALATATTTHAFVADADHMEVWDPAMALNAFPVIEITPTNGTLSAFNITSQAGNLNWAGVDIPSGETITINSIAPVVERGQTIDTMLTGVYDPANVDMAVLNGSFPIIVPTGSNFIEFEKIGGGGTATSFSIEVHYRKKFRR